MSGQSAQAKITLINEFKEQPVEPTPTPEAPKPSEPVVEKPSEPSKLVEAKTGHTSDPAVNPAALGGMLMVVAAGAGATIARTVRKRNDDA